MIIGIIEGDTRSLDYISYSDPLFKAEKGSHITYCSVYNTSCKRLPHSFGNPHASV